jgi:hypothetical protein
VAEHVEAGSWSQSVGVPSHAALQVQPDVVHVSDVRSSQSIGVPSQTVLPQVHWYELVQAVCVVMLEQGAGVPVHAVVDQ